MVSIIGVIRMRKYVLVLVLVLLLGGICLAQAPSASGGPGQAGRYKVFSEKRYFWGPKIIIMLDSETGKTWEYADNKWKPLIKEGEEKDAAAEEAKAKQQELMKALEEKQKEMEAAKTLPKPATPRVVRKKKTKPAEGEGEGDKGEGEEEPGWMKE
jgi:hypothetical protein